MTKPPRNVLVFGASGQIGSALVARLTASRGAKHVQRLSWREAATGGLDRISAEAMDFVFASGLTDPALGPGALLEANLEFPRSVAQWSASKGRDGDRFLTLGSILERFPDLCRTNPYLGSKLALAEWMSGQDALRFAHVRLHTVFGGTTKPHMFLGQMLGAIVRREKFRMSSGNQLREYVHVEDVARFVDDLLVRFEFGGPVVEFSSGNPVRLAELAQAVFRAYECEQLLEVGRLPVAPGENLNRQFARSPDWFESPKRNSINDVIAFLMRLHA